MSCLHPTVISVLSKFCNTGTCDYPLEQGNNSSISVEVVGYSNPALEGTSITLACPVGFVLFGHESTIARCMKNGEWEPDPRNVTCKESKPH